MTRHEIEELKARLLKLNKGDTLEAQFARSNGDLKWEPVCLIAKHLKGMPGKLLAVSVRPLSGPEDERDVITYVDHHVTEYSDYQYRGSLHGVSNLGSIDHVRTLPGPARRLEANVMADWLEEHGYPEASEALRKAFPLIPKE
jgi:hypothetical protein